MIEQERIIQISVIMFLLITTKVTWNTKNTDNIDPYYYNSVTGINNILRINLINMTLISYH